MNRRRGLYRLALGVLLLLGFWSAAGAVEPEKQPIYSNIQGGLLCGTSISNQCTVPVGRRLIIEYVSGYVFRPISDVDTISVSMAVKDSQLGLNGNSFHIFIAEKTNTTSERDVFAFSAPLKMMLHPGAQYYFSEAAGLAVSGYLVTVGLIPPPRPTIGPSR